MNTPITSLLPGEQTLDMLICGDNPKMYEHVEQLAKETFASGAGRELLAILNNAVPPMMGSIRIGGDNSPATVAYREGLREFSAFLYRYAGCPRHHVNPTQPKKK